MKAAISLKIIIGHRGTGKSSFLQRCSKNFPEQGPFYDLDTEIEKHQGRSIKDIFLTSGEEFFRKLESQIFQNLISNGKMIAVGAGFNLENIPDFAQVIWIRRSSDLQGRIFTDRPRLIKDVEPLMEYEIKRKDREPLFSARASLIYTVPEGLSLSLSALNLEEQLFRAQWNLPSQDQVQNVGGMRTFFAEDLRLKNLAEPDFFELRDDLLSGLQMVQQNQAYPQIKTLYALRAEKLNTIEENKKIISSSACIDQPITSHLQIANTKTQKIMRSSHQDDIYLGITELAKATDVHLKLSPLVLNWKDLWAGHQWHQKDPQNRSFLPRSLEGRWKWYRLFQKGRQELNFWYESQSSAADQPCLLEWILQPEKVLTFGAVVGSPVQHSFSPLMHFDFFKNRKSSFFAIDIKKHEWQEAFPILQSLGLVAAAVTSPLKRTVYEGTYLLTDLAKDLKAVNTLAWNKNIKNWQAENTDFLGFIKFLEGEDLPGPAVIWGGEGVLSTLQKALPEASAYSVRTGKPKEQNHDIDSPSVVIWAAPSRSEILFPPKHWQPKVVVDLNYAENSLGRTYAVKSHARYISGLKFFLGQAQEQQNFWLQVLDDNSMKDNS